MCFLTKITVLKFLAVQMVSVVAVGLHLDNLPTSIYYLIPGWVGQPHTAFPVKPCEM